MRCIVSIAALSSFNATASVHAPSSIPPQELYPAVAFNTEIDVRGALPAESASPDVTISRKQSFRWRIGGAIRRRAFRLHDMVISGQTVPSPSPPPPPDDPPSRCSCSSKGSRSSAEVCNSTMASYVAASCVRSTSSPPVFNLPWELQLPALADSTTLGLTAETPCTDTAHMTITGGAGSKAPQVVQAPKRSSKNKGSGGDTKRAIPVNSRYKTSTYPAVFTSSSVHEIARVEERQPTRPTATRTLTKWEYLGLIVQPRPRPYPHPKARMRTRFNA